MWRLLLLLPLTACDMLTHPLTSPGHITFGHAPGLHGDIDLSGLSVGHLVEARRAMPVFRDGRAEDPPPVGVGFLIEYTRSF